MGQSFLVEEPGLRLQENFGDLTSIHDETMKALGFKRIGTVLLRCSVVNGMLYNNLHISYIREGSLHIFHNIIIIGYMLGFDVTHAS